MKQVIASPPLKNGIRCYSQYDSGGTTHLCGIGFKVGSVHDASANIKIMTRGLAHLVEHIKCRESRRYSVEEVYRVFHKFAGMNVRTGFTDTFFGTFDLYSRQHMKLMWDMLVSLLKETIISGTGIDTEKSAIHQEYYLYGEDLPGELLGELLLRAIYERNPVRNGIVGDIDEVKTVSAQRIRSFIKRFYVPKNMFVVILGPRCDEALEMTRESFKDWGFDSAPIFDYDHSDDFHKLTSTRSLEIRREDIHQFHVAVGYPTETYMTEDAEALDVLAGILNFRLIQILREGNGDFNGGVYRTPVMTERSFVHGTIRASFATTSADYARYGEDVIFGEFQRLRRDLVSKRDFEDFRLAAELPYKIAFRDCPESLSDFIVEAACNGDEEMERLNSFRKRFHRLSRQQLRDVANKYFTKNYARAIVKPAQ